MFRILVVSLCLSLSLPTLAGGDTALEALRERLAPMENLSAGFQQQVLSADGHVVQEASGQMVVARPGRVYWHSEAPFEQIVVSDAETLWIYDPDLEQVIIRPFSRDIRNTPAVLFIGEVAELDDLYRVEREQEEGETVFRLMPRGEGSLYEKLALYFQGDAPVAMALWDGLGQETRIRLTDVTVNGKVDPARFRFEPPAGADILRDD